MIYLLKRTRRCLLVLFGSSSSPKIALGRKCSFYMWQLSVWNEFGNFTLADKFIGNIWKKKKKTFLKRCYKTSLCQVEYFPDTEFHLLTGNFWPKNISNSIGEIYTAHWFFFVLCSVELSILTFEAKQYYLGKNTNTKCEAVDLLHTCNLFIISFFFYYY